MKLVILGENTKAKAPRCLFKKRSMTPFSFRIGKLLLLIMMEYRVYVRQLRGNRLLGAIRCYDPNLELGSTYGSNFPWHVMKASAYPSKT